MIRFCILRHAARGDFNLTDSTPAHPTNSNFLNLAFSAAKCGGEIPIVYRAKRAAPHPGAGMLVQSKRRVALETSMTSISEGADATTAIPDPVRIPTWKTNLGSILAEQA